MKLKIALFVLACICTFNSCRDIIYNNPLDPNASKDVAKVIKVVSTSLSGSGDIDYVDGNVWKITPFSTLYLIDPESGASIRSFEGLPGFGIAYFDGRLYICNGENSIHIFDSLAGDKVDQLLTQDLFPFFLFIDDKGITLYDKRSSAFFQLDIDGGAQLKLFQVTGIQVSGICGFRDGILIGDSQTNSLYYFSRSGSLLSVYSSPSPDIVGISADNSDQIYLNSSDGRIFKLQLPQ